MKRNNNKKKTKQRYIAPKIVDTFSEEQLLKNVTAHQSVDWDIHPPVDPPWDIQSM